jgi:hypothetical protein
LAGGPHLTPPLLPGRRYAVCLGLLQEGEVVLGVLGCPNLPQSLVVDGDGQAGASDKGGAAGAGCLFLAHRWGAAACWGGGGACWGCPAIKRMAG